MDASRTALWTAWRTQGDDDAFARLVRPELAALHDAAQRTGLGAQDAEDVVQESLSELAAERSARPAQVGIGAWLMRSVRLKSLGALRGTRRRRRREQHVSGTPEPRSGAPGLDLREQVEAALLRLSDADRQILLFRFLYDLDYHEISYVLAISENACRVRVHRASKRMRDLTSVRGLTALALVPLAEPPHAAAMTAAALTAAATGSSVAWIGATVMSTGSKFAFAAVGLLALVGGALFVTRADPAAPTEPVHVAASAGERGPELRGVSPPPLPPESEAPAGEAGPPAPAGVGRAWLYVHVTGTDGKPLAGAQIHALGGALQHISRASTLEDGTSWFSQQAIKHVVVWKRGAYAPQTQVVSRPPPGEEEHVRMQLAVAQVIAGRIEAADGGALAAVTVSARPVDPPAWLPEPGRRYRGRSDAHGRFRIAGLLPGTYELHVRPSPKRHAGAGLMPAPAPRFEAGERGALLRLLPSGAFHLVVLDATTGEVIEAPRDLFRIVDGADVWMQSFAKGPAKRERPPNTVETLRVHAEGYAPSEVLVLDYSRPRVLEILLEPHDASMGTIVFHLVDAGGRPVRAFGCTRWHQRDVGEEAPISYGVGESYKDVRGEHRVRLPVGRQRLSFDPMGDDGTPLRSLAPRDVLVTVAPGEERVVRVAFERTGSVRIPLPARWVRAGLVLWNSDDEPVRRFSIETIATGGRVLHRILPGAYQLELEVGQGKSLRRPVTVVAGETVEVDFTKLPVVRRP